MVLEQFILSKKGHQAPSPPPPLHNPLPETIFSSQSTENIWFKRNGSEQTDANKRKRIKNMESGTSLVTR
jgi:hypothetical protein